MVNTSLPFIAGNWKMNGLKVPAMELVTALGAALTNQPKECEVAIFPPATLLISLMNICKQYGIQLGGQDCSSEEKGAFTGDISAAMLKDAGCNYVILGHSERRCLHLETSTTIRDKAAAAHRAGLVTIICVGETQEQREKGQALAVIHQQLVESIPLSAIYENSIIAYEPVWAIGTGKTPTLEEIRDTHHFIADNALKQFEKPFRILYGGSVKAANAKDLLLVPQVGGLLVGGASLEKGEFLGIIEAARSSSSPRRRGSIR